jgi:hypothetical protein
LPATLLPSKGDPPQRNRSPVVPVVRCLSFACSLGGRKIGEVAGVQQAAPVIPLGLLAANLGALEPRATRHEHDPLGGQRLLDRVESRRVRVDFPGLDAFSAAQWPVAATMAHVSCEIAIISLRLSCFQPRNRDVVAAGDVAQRLVSPAAAFDPSRIW